MYTSAARGCNIDGFVAAILIDALGIFPPWLYSYSVSPVKNGREYIRKEHMIWDQEPI